MRRLVPYPLLWLLLLALWLLLQGSASPGALLVGGVLALAGVAALRALRLPPGGMRRLRPVPGLLLSVAAEVVRSNSAVARIILDPRRASRRSGFVSVPLTLRSPAALSALAVILTATPGTVWVDHDEEAGTMLLHVLDDIGQEEWARLIAERWEKPLKEIFE